MGLGVRFYLFAESGLQRISQRLMDGLAHGNDAMPQFAGTTNVLVEIDNAKPVKIERADGSFLTFDENVWHATVEILRWDVTHHSGESVSSFHERYNSKKEAEEAARRMLAENAKHFSAEFSVEASVVCELEWYESGPEPALASKLAGRRGFADWRNGVGGHSESGKLANAFKGITEPEFSELTLILLVARADFHSPIRRFGQPVLRFATICNLRLTGPEIPAFRASSLSPDSRSFSLGSGIAKSLRPCPRIFPFWGRPRGHAGAVKDRNLRFGVFRMS
jgi:hypothetical protein